MNIPPRHGAIQAAVHLMPFSICIGGLLEKSSPQKDEDGFTKHTWAAKQPIPLLFEPVSVIGNNAESIHFTYTPISDGLSSWTGEFGGTSLTLALPDWQALRLAVKTAEDSWAASHAEMKKCKQQHRDAVSDLQAKCKLAGHVVKKPPKPRFCQQPVYREPPARECTRCGCEINRVYLC